MKKIIISIILAILIAGCASRPSCDAYSYEKVDSTTSI